MENSFSIVKKYSKSIPVDLEALCSDLGICIVYKYLGEDISGSIERSVAPDCDYTITVNSEDSLTRQRFTIAHELGHFLFHRNKIGDGIFDDRLYRHNADRPNREVDQQDETQANSFAANLLMPVLYIRERSEAGVAPSRLADELIVSLAALRIRLKTLIAKDRRDERETNLNSNAALEYEV